MLKDFLISFTKQYHELGHENFIGFGDLETNATVNQMIDGAKGYGHRLKEGHDFSGLLESIELDGVTGAATWFDHMLKDFTSHDGIPLPGAMFIKDLTGMDYKESIDWLNINASDVLEVGGTAFALKLIEKKFNNNPKLKMVTLAVSGCLGILDDNPLLIAYTTIKAAKEINNKFKVISQKGLDNFKLVSRNLYRGVKIVSVGTFFTGITAQVFMDTNLVEFITDISTSAIENFDVLAETTGILGDLIDVGDAADLAGNVGDLVDGFGTLGLGIALSQGVKYSFKYFNKGVADRVQKKFMKLTCKAHIIESLKHDLPPNLIAGYLTAGEKEGIYKRLLSN